MQQICLRPQHPVNQAALTVWREPDHSRQLFEQEMNQGGIPLPLTHRCAWARAHPAVGSWFLGFRDGRGVCLGGFAVEVHRSRALPGHHILRVDRFGADLPAIVRGPGLVALVDLARRDHRALRLHVELFERNAAERAALEKSLQQHGFRPAIDPRRYATTLVVDLTPPEEEIFARFDKKARQKIRQAQARSLQMRVIDDAGLAGRIDELLRKTMSRTDGHYLPEDWAAQIALSKRLPAYSRLIGMFATDRSGPSALMAMAWGCHHGTFAHSEISARDPEVNLPLNDTLTWELICWAKRQGGRWLDLGGITPGSANDRSDRLGSISDFKRKFSSEVVEVGGEWILEPHWVRGRLASAIGSGVALFGRVRTTLSKGVRMTR